MEKHEGRPPHESSAMVDWLVGGAGHLPLQALQPWINIPNLGLGPINGIVLRLLPVRLLFRCHVSLRIETNLVFLSQLLQVAFSTA